MRKLLATLSLAIMTAVLAGPALSDDRSRIACSLSDDSGYTVALAFAGYGRNRLIQTAMENNGSMTVHSTDERPVWSFETSRDEKFLLLSFELDSRIKIVMDNKRSYRTKDGMRAVEAAMVNGKSIVGKGACVFDLSGLSE